MFFWVFLCCQIFRRHVFAGGERFIGNASYNSFRNQVGFCKLQGFDTVSRDSSSSIPAFLTASIFIGVGLNGQQFRHNISNCGRCLQIHAIENFPGWNKNLTEWKVDESPQFPFLAMVMDECNDPICQKGFLDFDIYHTSQPVQSGNPYHVAWEFVDCPRVAIPEVLFCFSNTCKEKDVMGRTVNDVLKEANPYFWSLFVRNLVQPISSVYIPEYHVFLEPKEGWFWNFGKFDFFQPFSIQLSNGWVIPVNFDKKRDQLTEDAYRGGILVS